ncbi:MAG: hypothetical protein H7A21_07225 [Spirochaetales bacterium]|nr:hypothetical protein [Leptospiraceae bacterium]MCP5481205.1 hypothetical protein [Spirochaetales bacterium]
MRIAAWQATAHVLQVLAIFALCLALIPILYPIVLALALLVLFSGAAVMYFYPTARTGEETLGTWIGRHGPLRRSYRSMRVAFAAAVLVLVLFGLLRWHSYSCYVNELDRELEPFREAFRREGPRTETNVESLPQSGIEVDP